MKIELKNGETFDSINDFNYSINDCTSCKYLNNCKIKIVNVFLTMNL